MKVVATIGRPAVGCCEFAGGFGQIRIRFPRAGNASPYILF